VSNPGHHGRLVTQVCGHKKAMQLRKVIQRRIRRTGEGVDLIGDVNAAISTNVGEPGSTSHVSSRSTVSAHSQDKEARRDESQ